MCGKKLFHFPAVHLQVGELQLLQVTDLQIVLDFLAVAPPHLTDGLAKVLLDLLLRTKLLQQPLHLLIQELIHLVFVHFDRLGLSLG